MTKHPTNRFYHPQVGDQPQHSVQVGSTGAYTVLPSSNLDEAAVNYDSHSINATNTTFISGSVGIFPWLNIDIEGGNDLPLMFGARMRAFELGFFSMGGKIGYGAMMAGGSSEELTRPYLISTFAQNYEAMMGFDILDFWKISAGHYSYIYKVYLEFTDDSAYPGGKGGHNSGFYLNNHFKYNWIISTISLSKATIDYGNEERSDLFFGWSLGVEF